MERCGHSFEARSLELAWSSKPLEWLYRDWGAGDSASSVPGVGARHRLQSKGVSYLTCCLTVNGTIASDEHKRQGKLFMKH